VPWSVPAHWPISADTTSGWLKRSSAWAPAWLYRHKNAALAERKKTVELHQDLYLPCGVMTLAELHASMGLGEATLVELARVRVDASYPARITAVGEYYALHPGYLRDRHRRPCLCLALAMTTSRLSWPERRA
jgi:hypothetical protein